MIPEILNDGYGIIPRKIMRNKKLNIYEKVILAYFLSFTGAGKNCCWPSLNTMVDELGISKNTIIKTIKLLESKSYICKQRYNEKDKFSVNKYTMNFCATTGEKYKIDIHEPSSPHEPDLVHHVNHPGSPHEPDLVHHVNPNINSININNDNYKKEKKKSTKKVDKISYRDYVTLTEKEMNTLKDKYRLTDIDRALDKLNYYKQANGKKYKSDYGALNQWVFESINAKRKEFEKEYIEVQGINYEK